MKPLLLLICVACLGLSGGVVGGQQPDEPRVKREEPIDFEKARQLLRKQRDGQKLTPEEQAYVDRARAARGQNPQRPNANQPAGASEPKPSLGLKPLNEMTDEDRYKEEDGGLYGRGNNTPPKNHLDAALVLSRSIVPLDADGQPDPQNGKIVLISNGMSNTTQEFQAFLAMFRQDAKRSNKLVIVDGAQGGMEARAWSVSATDPAAAPRNPWDVLAQRLRQANVTPAQVQLLWMKQAQAGPARLGEYPKHVEETNSHLVVVLQQLRETYPNLKLAYLSSRIYAGNARSALNPEPYAYEGGFGVRRLILKQIAGDPELNYNPGKGPVKAPLLLWGPYLWADGTTPRTSDGLVWLPEDFATDGTHPSNSGRDKVARQLLDFFHADPTAKLWYLGR